MSPNKKSDSIKKFGMWYSKVIHKYGFGYGSLFTVMLLDINKGVELFIYTLKTSLTSLIMGHVSRAGTPIFNRISTAAISCRMRCCRSHTLCRLDHEPRDQANRGCENDNSTSYRRRRQSRCG